MNKIDDYYSGSYTGKPITGILYQLCQQLNKESNKLLWLWILGLTDQKMHFKINNNLYEKAAQEIDKEVVKLNYKGTESSSYIQ